MRAELERRIRELPRAGISAIDVAALGEVAPNQLERLNELVDREWQRFSNDGLMAMEALTGVAAPCREPMTFRMAEHYRTGIGEQSALTFVSPEVGFLVVADDTSSIFRVAPGADGEVRVDELLSDEALEGLEGAAYDPKRSVLRVVSEDSRKVYEMDLEVNDGDVKLSRPKKVGKLDKAGRRKNKSWEGLELLSADMSPDRRPWQIAVNEGSPRRVTFFDPKDLESGGHAKIPDDAKPYLPDLSDVAVSPRGTLFLLSDEGNAICELGIRKLDRPVGDGRPLGEWKLVFLGKTDIDAKNLPLDGADRLQPEGLAFDQKGDLWVACEANSLLIRFAKD